MAKKAKKEGKKIFPKPEGEEGAPDRFIPPDRSDIRARDPDDKEQVLQVKNLAEDLEVVEDDSTVNTDEEDGGDGEDEPLRSEGDDDDGGERRRAPRRRAQSRGADEREEGEEEDTRGYSRRVQQRINRERALRAADQQARQSAERRAKQMEDRVAKLERITTDVQANGGVKELEAKIETLKGQLKTAIDEGKTAEQLELTVKLSDAQGDLKLLKRDLEAARRTQIDEDKRKEDEQERTDAAANAATTADVTADWQRANRSWWNKRAFADQKDDAIALDNDILDEINAGELDIEKYSDEHFEILNERLAKLYPNLDLHNANGAAFELAEEEEEVTQKRRDDRSRNGRDTRRRPPVNGNGTRNTGRRQQTDADLARQGKVRLNEDDFATMRMFGLDPDNAKHKKAFGTERMRTVLTKDRRESRGER